MYVLNSACSSVVCWSWTAATFLSCSTFFSPSNLGRFPSGFAFGGFSSLCPALSDTLLVGFVLAAVFLGLFVTGTSDWGGSVFPDSGEIPVELVGETCRVEVLFSRLSFDAFPATQVLDLALLSTLLLDWERLRAIMGSFGSLDTVEVGLVLSPGSALNVSLLSSTFFSSSTVFSTFFPRPLRPRPRPLAPLPLPLPLRCPFPVSSSSL